MKVCVTIPAYNEEETVAEVVEDCRAVLEQEGYDHDIIVMDDGSTDRTAEVAEEAGAVVYSHRTNRGLGRTFASAMRHALDHDPDIIVNIDADGQYEPAEMPDLIGPVAAGDADLAVGDRQVMSLDYKSLPNKLGNTLGSLVTSVLAEHRIRDAQSGYRAFTPELAAQWTVMSSYTYVQETLIQAAHDGYTIEQVPITFYERDSGGSRLVSSLPSYVSRATRIVIRAYRDYKPMRTFSLIALGFFLLAAVPGYQVASNFLATGSFELVGRGLLVVLLGVAGALTLVFGLLADMLKRHREIMEEILQEVQRGG
ncbi:MAG: glycosyltransferase [Candidatus Nanohaloarchaea archaeon]|nr:glycosyltransferase [Candidatus Nanohaloarchaea archaeon]